MSDSFTPDFATIGQAPPTWNAKRPIRIAWFSLVLPTVREDTQLSMSAAR